MAGARPRPASAASAPPAIRARGAAAARTVFMVVPPISWRTSWTAAAERPMTGNGSAEAKLRMRGARIGGLGQMAGEGRAIARLALQRHPAPVQLDQRLDQGQPQPRPAAVAADEAVEDVRLDVEGDAPAGVA